jgi:hypothetical protein
MLVGAQAVAACVVAPLPLAAVLVGEVRPPLAQWCGVDVVHGLINIVLYWGEGPSERDRDCDGGDAGDCYAPRRRSAVVPRREVAIGGLRVDLVDRKAYGCFERRVWIIRCLLLDFAFPVFAPHGSRSCGGACAWSVQHLESDVVVPVHYIRKEGSAFSLALL